LIIPPLANKVLHTVLDFSKKFSHLLTRYPKNWLGVSYGIQITLLFPVEEQAGQLFILQLTAVSTRIDRVNNDFTQCLCGFKSV